MVVIRLLVLLWVNSSKSFFCFFVLFLFVVFFFFNDTATTEIYTLSLHDALPSGEIPIIWLALRGNRTLQDLSVYAKNVLKRKLETIDGVGSIVIGGEQERNIRVNLDFNRMSAFGITVQDIVMAFRNEHIKLPGGFLIDNSKEDLLKLDLESHNVEEIENIIVTYDRNRAIKIRDIAEVKDDVRDRKSTRLNSVTSRSRMPSSA